MTHLLEQYEQELKQAKQIQKELIKNGKFGAPLQHINLKIEILNRFVNDLKKAIDCR